MDPLTILGLASNIIQFVDFTSKLISATHSLYVSASGASSENLELETLARDLQRLTSQIKPPDIINSGVLRTEEEKDLLNLSSQCLEVSAELLSVLDSIRVKGNHRKWRSFYQAFQSVRKKEEIDALQKRLDRIEYRLGVRSLIHKQDTVIAKLDEMNLDGQNARTNEITQLQEEFKRLFTDIKLGTDENTMNQKAVLERLSLSAQKGVEYESEQRILATLSFPTMVDRHTTIRAAHARTFSWIFEESSAQRISRAPTSFVEWLRSTETLYWVSGKPGSGKSTLMKYLSENEAVIRQHLIVWTGEQTLIIPSFFFWNAGRIVLQKSQEGLLRSMLYQVLRRCPALISKAFPGHWYPYISGGLSPGSSSQFLTISELLAAFQRIATELASCKIKLFFLIDGLDEYDGKPNDIIHLIEVLKTSNQVKICVSSRPWNEFEKVYGQDASRKLYVESLTKQDIESYVRDTLEKDPNYQDLVDEEGDGQSLDLVQDIVDAAQGVFLWVFLVVRSLLEGLTNADRVVDLQRRLRLLPTDLNEYFERMLFTIDSFYRRQTAQMFQVTLVSREILPLMSYWFVHQHDAELAFKLMVEPLSIQKTTVRLKQMRKRLNACCKGLLEVNFYDASNYNDSTLSSSVLFDWKVDFLHRTVRDFLILPDMQAMLDEWAGDDFDADKAICQAILCQIKSAPQEVEYFRSDGPVSNLAQTMYYHAGALKNDPDHEQDGKLLVRELEQTMSEQKEVIGMWNEELLAGSGSRLAEDFQNQSFLGRLSRLRTMLSIG